MLSDRGPVSFAREERGKDWVLRDQITAERRQRSDLLYFHTHSEPRARVYLLVKSTMKIDIFCHIFPEGAFRRFFEAAPNLKDMGKRVKNVPDRKSTRLNSSHL